MPVAGEPIRDRLASLSRPEVAGVVVVLVVSVIGAGLWYQRSLPRPVEVRADAPAPSGAAPSASPSSSAVVLVDVAGWVRRPGVYEFQEGARVVDALDAAGGARPGAMLEALNLAAPLADGTQVFVPKEGASAAPVPPADAGTVAGSGDAPLINVNTATAEELDVLPGVGEVISQAIVDHRTENGPFTSVDQLVDVSGIGEVTLEKLRPLVTV